MQTTYVAYGLELRSSFPLPGMSHAATGTIVKEALPPLTLELMAPPQLQRAWSGFGGVPIWQGRLGDGCILSIEEGTDGDLLFTYADRACFRLHPDRSALDCAPSQAGLHWQQALIGKVLPNISLLRGYEALHACVVDSPEGVVAIAGPSGAGKSTLASELLRRGWPLFADDVLILESAGGEVRAHPGTPHMNLAASLPDAIDPRTLGTTLGTLAGERWLAAHTITKRPRPVRMVCLLDRGPSFALQTCNLPSNPRPLAPYMLGLSSDAERQRSRFCLYADLMESAALVRLTAGFEHRPGELADLLEQALARRPALLAGGIT